MLFRQIDVPSLHRRLSNVMACPSSAEPDSHERGLEEYRRLGGNCIHLHGEGGETHSRRAIGRWLKQKGLRKDFFLCAQICHEGWDPVAQCAVDRLTPEAVITDIATDLSLLETDYLDFVYVANSSGKSIEPIMDTIANEINRGRVRAFGLRNWTPGDIRAAHAYLVKIGAPGIAAIVTTELALPAAMYPLWPQDIPFGQLETTVRDMGLAVFAHADAFNLGEQLFADDGKQSHPRWKQLWESPMNRKLAGSVRETAATRRIAPEEINLAWLFNRSFPVIAMISLPDLLSDRRIHLERASGMIEPIPISR